MGPEEVAAQKGAVFFADHYFAEAFCVIHRHGFSVGAELRLQTLHRDTGRLGLIFRHTDTCRFGHSKHCGGNDTEIY